MNISGWLRATNNLWMMRKLNRGRFNDILKEADLYGQPEAKNMQFEGRTATFGYNGKKVVLEACEIDIIEVFFRETYSKLNVKGKIVADVGCGAGDTAVYFLLRGAKFVSGYDIEKERIEIGRNNLRRNKLQWKADLYTREVTSLKELVGEVLKMDIEGAEHKIFAEATDKDILRFPQIIMECHDGKHFGIASRLTGLGYKVELYNPTFNGRNIMLYAKKEERTACKACGGYLKTEEKPPLCEDCQTEKAYQKRLNPTWVEWLMGFPLAWTELSASEMPSSRRPRKPSGK